MWVSNPERMAREAIPQYYPHSSYASWTRALHAHSFRKLSPSTWGHPDFHRDRPEAAATIGRRRPTAKKPAAGQPAASRSVEAALSEEQDDALSLAALSLAPLTAQRDDDDDGRTTTTAEGDAEGDECGSEGEKCGEKCEGEDCGAAPGRDEVQQQEAVEGETSTAAAKEKPSPVQAARLAALREQIVREREAMRQLTAAVEKLEAQVTRARREELQQRSQVVQLASWVATAAATSGLKMPASLAGMPSLESAIRELDVSRDAIAPSPLLICSAAS